MPMPRRGLLSAVLPGLLALGALHAPHPAAGQAFPDRPMRLVVPYPPGGSTDPVARMLAGQMQTILGQPMIVENRSGAAGSIGTEHVVRSAPDGYTVLLHTTVIATEPSAKTTLPYNSETDLIPVTEAVRGSYLLVGNPNLPVQDVAGLIAHVRANPNKIAYGSAGTGSSGHLIGEMFAMRAGLTVTHVPYRGGGPSITALLANEIQYVFDTVPTSRPLVLDGQLRGLAITGAQRSPLLPQVPTVTESGLPGFEVGFWLGIFAPARTPAPIVQQISTAFQKALGDPAVRERLTSIDLTPVGSSPEDFARTFRSDVASWREVIQRAKIRLD